MGDQITMTISTSKYSLYTSHQAYFLTSLKSIHKVSLLLKVSYWLTKYCMIVFLDIWEAINIYEQVGNTSWWNTKQPSHLL